MPEMGGDVGDSKPQVLAGDRRQRDAPGVEDAAEGLRLEAGGDVDERGGLKAQRVRR